VPFEAAKSTVTQSGTALCTVLLLIVL